jgi:large subunit ribosomal protein L24
MTKVHIKKGDNVVVITGKDAGKEGKVLAVDTKKGKVVVEKVAVVSKHNKPTQANPQGGINAQEAFIDASNVMIYCNKCKKGVRIKHDAEGARVCAKCGSKLD